MAAEAGQQGLSELLARARVAVLDLAPEESADGSAEAISAGAAARASAAIAAVAAALEHEDDTLRALLAVDMALAVDEAPSAPGRGRGKLVAMLVQALSVLAGDPPAEPGTGAFASRSPLALANELRALRGAPLLSGNIVFAIAVDAGTPASEPSADPDPRLAASAKRLRSYYQQGLIAWLGDDTRAKAGAARIGEVFARLHALSQGSAQEALWRAAACFANLLRDASWRTSAAVKRLLGQLDGRLKRLADGGGEGAAPLQDAAPALLQDLLFYVSESRDVDATISVFPSRSALLEAFAAPPRADSDQPTAALSLLNELLAISSQLMEALAPGESWTPKRSWLSERMLHVADGLGLLGVHGLRRRTLEEIALLRKTPGSGDPPPGGWGRMAERLHALGAELLTAAGMQPAAAVAEDTAGMPASGHIARRLEADLVHAEGVIQRLELGAISVPVEPSAASGVEDEQEDVVGGAAHFRQRLDAFTGAIRSEDRDAPGEELPPVALDHELLDDIGGFAGEIDTARARLEQQVGAFREGLQDMDNSIRALREELDTLRSHAGSSRLRDDGADAGALPAEGGDAPPVAGMRQRLERLAGGLSALSELRDSIDSIAADSRSILVQQARDHVALEQRLMQHRMQPLDAQLEALGAEIAERAAHAGKQVLLRVDAGDLRIEPEKMAALLPVLRSLAVSMIATGIEPPRARVLAGRAPGCLLDMRFKRRGADLNMLLCADCKPPAEDAVAEAQAFLRPLGGLLELAAADRNETRCHLQMPLAPRVSTVLLVAVGGEILALPLAEVSAVLQLSADELAAAEESGLEHQDALWRVGHLSVLLGLGEADPAHRPSRPALVLMVSEGERHALVVDAIGERVDVVVRSVAPQLRALGGLAGAAILGDGQVVLLLDVAALMAARYPSSATSLESVS